MFFSFLSVLFCIQLVPQQTETLRSRTAVLFDDFDWAPPLDSTRRGELSGRTVPGGNESFASLYRVSSVKAEYPSLEGLGFLDYSGMNAGLRLFLLRFSDTVVKNEPSFSDYFPYGSAESFFFNHRLSLLSAITMVHFGAALPLTSGGYEVPFRIITGTQPDEKPVFFRLFIISADGNWKIESVIFDGDSYEAAVKSH